MKHYTEGWLIRVSQTMLAFALQESAECDATDKGTPVTGKESPSPNRLTWIYILSYIIQMAFKTRFLDHDFMKTLFI